MNRSYWKSACIWTSELIPELEKRDDNSHSISLFFSLYDIHTKKVWIPEFRRLHKQSELQTFQQVVSLQFIGIKKYRLQNTNKIYKKYISIYFIKRELSCKIGVPNLSSMLARLVLMSGLFLTTDCIESLTLTAEETGRLNHLFFWTTCHCTQCSIVHEGDTFTPQLCTSTEACKQGALRQEPYLFASNLCQILQG